MIPITGGNTTDHARDARHEAAAMLALSILEQRMSHRDRLTGPDRAAFVELAVTEAQMALAGATLEQITSYHLRATA